MSKRPLRTKELVGELGICVTNLTYCNRTMQMPANRPPSRLE
ncbi:6046_t:CDS:1, partial [Gigaspora rosea]